MLREPEHREALEFVLITHGLRLDWLGDERLSWRDLFVIARQSPSSSALAQSILGVEVTEWGLNEQLLAQLIDLTAWLVWSKTTDGQKGTNRPKPTPRPGVIPDADSSQFGSEPLSIEDMREWLGWQKPAEPVPPKPDDAEAVDG